MSLTKTVTFLAGALLLLTSLWWLFNPSDKGAANIRGESPTQNTSAENPELEAVPRFIAGNVEVGILIEPAVPRVGDNKISVLLSDKNGKAIEDASIDAYAEMPAMGAMPAMRAPAGLKHTAAGRYEGEMDLSMRGEWPLTIKISSPNYGNQRIQFDYATDREGLSIASGGVSVGQAQGLGNQQNEPTFRINNRRRQLIGMKTAVASHQDLKKTIRAVGEVQYDERLLSNIVVKFDGYIGDLKTNYEGAEIKKGDTLFTIYSPDLLAAQQEYLETLKRRRKHGRKDPLISAARQRLELWDISQTAIGALERRGSPTNYLAIVAPRSGTLIKRHITDGSAVKAGQTLLSIADLSQVWVEADVYESDLEQLSLGMEVNIRLPYFPGREFHGALEYISPSLQEKSRTTRVRLTLDNSNRELKPGMFAEVSLQADLGHRLAVPEQAVLIAGNSRIVFVDLGGGQLKPAHVKTGRHAQGFIEITEGISLGDTIVSSANFLIAAEARLKMGAEQW